MALRDPLKEQRRTSKTVTESVVVVIIASIGTVLHPEYAITITTLSLLL